MTSIDVAYIYKGSEEDKDNRIFLFVRKNKDDHEAKEHEAAKWLTPEEMDSVDWLPADLGVVEKLKRQCSNAAAEVSPRLR